MKTSGWIGVFLCIAALCALWILLFPGETDAQRIEIRSDGALIAVLPLDEDAEIDVVGHNTVTVRDGKVAVTHADCPDQICVRRGWCSGGRDIVCLPNRLVIHFLNGSEVDFAVG